MPADNCIWLGVQPKSREGDSAELPAENRDWQQPKPEECEAAKWFACNSHGGWMSGVNSFGAPQIICFTWSCVDVSCFVFRLHRNDFCVRA